MVNSLILSLALLGQVPIPSMTVPPTSEKSVVFMDRGRVYIVGVESGKVLTLDNSPAPNPTPDDDVTPEPVPPVSLSYKYAALILPRNDGRNAWRDAATVLDAVKGKNATIRFYGDDEQDIDKLNYRKLVTEKGLPLLLLFDENRKLIESKKVDDEAGLIGALK